MTTRRASPDRLDPSPPRRGLDVLEAASAAVGDARRTSEVLVPVLEAVARALDASLAEAWILEPHGRRMALLVDWCATPDAMVALRTRHARLSVARHQGPVGHAWGAGRAIVEHTPAQREPDERTSWAAPVPVGGSTCAVLAFHGRGAEARDEAGVLSALTTIGRQVGTAIERVEMQRMAATYQLSDDRWMDTSPDAVVVLDRRGAVAEWNRAAAELTGHATGEAMGRDLPRLVAPDRWRARMRRELARALSGRRDWLERPFEVPVRCRDGGEKVIEAWLGRVQQGRAPSLVIHARDVTETRRERLALRRAASRAANETRSREDFLAMLAHELRSPLAPIVATLELLDPNDPTGVEHARGVLQRQAGHLTRLLDDLLEAARCARDKVSLDPGEVRIRDVVQLAVEMVQPQVDRRGQRLDVDVEGDPWVEGDRARLAQVLSNLLTNASRYGRAGGPVQLTVRVEGDEVVWVVRDDGRGMTGAFLARAFEPFTQHAAENGDDRGAIGLGLGLWLVRSLVELHGGKVHAHSDGPGLGTRMEVRLPRAAAPSEPPPEREPAREARRSVLIVEDDEDAAEMLALALQSRGHEVRVARDGRSALASMAAEPPDVALVDVGLPDMDGYALARAVRERIDAPVHLVAVTGFDGDAHRARARESGFDRRLVKPAPVESVLDALDALEP
ncbi:MAG TPA: ATP-binding protein [Sandaracinaceae bacterium LLY-WYZ-13_1]|nr:ATP-binding protein [Sandaracinaceae bacterium LLY-WYZ-13_1]